MDFFDFSFLFVVIRPAELLHDAVVLGRALLIRHRAVIIAVGGRSHGERDALHAVAHDFTVHNGEGALEDRRIRVREPRLAAETEVRLTINNVFTIIEFDRLESVRMGSDIDVRAVVDDIVRQVDRRLLRLVHTLDTDMAGNNDDVTAFSSEDIDRIVIEGSLVSEVKAGHADLHALHLIDVEVGIITPYDTCVVEYFSCLDMTFLGIVEHVVVCEVTALDAGFLQDLDVLRVHFEVDLALRTKRRGRRHRALEITEGHIIGLKIRQCF